MGIFGSGVINDGVFVVIIGSNDYVVVWVEDDMGCFFVVVVFGGDC